MEISRHVIEVVGQLLTGGDKLCFCGSIRRIFHHFFQTGLYLVKNTGKSGLSVIVEILFHDAHVVLFSVIFSQLGCIGTKLFIVKNIADTLNSQCLYTCTGTSVCGKGSDGSCGLLHDFLAAVSVSFCVGYVICCCI